MVPISLWYLSTYGTYLPMVPIYYGNYLPMVPIYLWYLSTYNTHIPMIPTYLSLYFHLVMHPPIFRLPQPLLCLFCIPVDMRILAYMQFVASVTIFGKISPLWQNKYGAIFNGLFSTWQIFGPTLVNKFMLLGKLSLLQIVK